MQIAKTIEIELRNGQTITLDMTPELLRNIRTTFTLASDEDVTERHVKYFIASALKNMLEVKDVE
jgi:hypothetical protein